MKTTILFVTLCLCALFTCAQINPKTPWIWMKGDNTINQFGEYGTPGVPHSTNKPGGRNSSSTWRDATGNLWLFGGMGYGTTSSGFLNDLWKFDPVTNKWAWLKGNNEPNQYAVYGNPGVTDSSNKPGGAYSGASWIDKEGNFWLFGGCGYSENTEGLLNTLWKYDVTVNEWVWVNGDKAVDMPGVYGTQGIADPANKPGARYCSQSWTDKDGNFWLFGGYGFDGINCGILNDLWKYNPSTNEWTWVKGSDLIDQPGIYGTKGIADPNSNPGGRYLSTSWKDQSGNIWLFGGSGYDEMNSDILNDLWKYDPSTNEWTWVNGDKTINQPGVYGMLGVSANENKPGARYISCSWMGAGGELLLFGGYGYDHTQPGYLNDLWKYNPATDTWTWIKGDNIIDQVSIYGTQGIADSSNKSGARTGSVSWTDGTGNLWLFGGYGFDVSASGILNDLWKINSYQVPPFKLIDFSGVLANRTTRLKWEAEQADQSRFNVQRSFDGINFTTIGIVYGTANRQYTFHDQDVQNYAIQKVYYRLELVNKSGGSGYSKTLRFDLESDIRITMFPNPAVHSLNLSFRHSRYSTMKVEITDINGITVKKQTADIFAGRTSLQIDVSHLPAATYFITVISQESIFQQKFIKQ